jgi:hypothetical protein
VEERFILSTLPPQFDHGAIEDILRDSIDHYGVVLAIIDTRGKSLGAGQLEDSADTANHVQGLLSRVAAETGCTVIAAHHTPLNDKGRGRGSSGWTQGADFAWIIQGSARTFAAGDPVALAVFKSRDATWHRPIRFELRYPVRMTIGGNPVAGAVIERSGEAFGQFPIEARAFLAIKSDPGCSKQAVRDSVSGANSKIDSAIEKLLELGAIEDRGDSNRRRYQASPGWEVELDGAVRHANGDPPRPRIALPLEETDDGANLDEHASA